jgi:hypothetical protein
MARGARRRLTPAAENQRRRWRMSAAVKPEARAERMRIHFRWSPAYSLSSRFGLPCNRARRSETAATRGRATRPSQRGPARRSETAATRCTQRPQAAQRARRTPGVLRIDASSSRHAAAAPRRPRPPGRRPLGRLVAPRLRPRRPKPAGARDGARFRAGASLRACFGLREARQDGEPSQVEAHLGCASDLPSLRGPGMAPQA